LGVSPIPSIELETGSYSCVARCGDSEVIYPLVITRARKCTVHIRIHAGDSIPEGMVLIPGGRFMAMLPRANRLSEQQVPDFAIGRFPVTFGDYIRFLDELDDELRRERVPATVQTGPYLERTRNAWRVTDACIEGPARKYVPREAELLLPVHGVSWHRAAAFIDWIASRERRAYRLPADLEWEKAMRGADGRNFPMGNHLDPAFAKLRESRPEAAQCEPIGAFPLDVSPYGVRDLAGGVGDWTSTMVDGRPPPSPEEEGTSADDRQAYWRGGTWGTTATAPRALRYTQMLRHGTANVGFRLALSLPGPSSSLEVTPLKR
jgi:serine/threonine-protein kinase